MRRLVGIVALAIAAAACGAAGDGGSASGGSEAERTEGERAAKDEKAKRIDPRRGGLEVALGEWAVTPETTKIRPGPVTFVIANRGTITHGFEIESELGDGDNSGPGGGDHGLKFETETIEPGESVELELDLSAGIYKLECFIDGHDDRGMENILEVRKDAPLQRENGAGGTKVTIEGFAFQPPTIEVPLGTDLTWTNSDPTQHTITAEDGTFDSGEVAAGSDFTVTFDTGGTYAYFCKIHPDMKGTVQVA